MNKLAIKPGSNDLYKRLLGIQPDLEDAIRKGIHLDHLDPNVVIMPLTTPIVTLLFVPRGAINDPDSMPLTDDQTTELRRKADYIGENIEQIALRLNLNVEGGCQRLYDYKAPRGYTFSLRGD